MAKDYRNWEWIYPPLLKYSTGLLGIYGGIWVGVPVDHGFGCERNIIIGVFGDISTDTFIGRTGT